MPWPWSRGGGVFIVPRTCCFTWTLFCVLIRRTELESKVLRMYFHPEPFSWAHTAFEPEGILYKFFNVCFKTGPQFFTVWRQSPFTIIIRYWGQHPYVKKHSIRLRAFFCTTQQHKWKWCLKFYLLMYDQ